MLKEIFFFFFLLVKQYFFDIHKKKVTPKFFRVLCVTSRFFTKNSSVFPLDDEAANRRMSFFHQTVLRVSEKKNIFPVYNKKSIFTWSKKFLLFSFFEGSVIFPVFQTANRKMDLIDSEFGFFGRGGRCQQHFGYFIINFVVSWFQYLWSKNYIVKCVELFLYQELFFFC